MTPTCTVFPLIPWADYPYVDCSWDNSLIYRTDDQAIWIQLPARATNCSPPHPYHPCGRSTLSSNENQKSSSPRLQRLIRDGNIPYHLLTTLRTRAAVQLYRHPPTCLSVVLIKWWHTKLNPAHLHSAETPIMVNLIERVSPVVQATSPTMLYGVKHGDLAGVQLYTVGVFTWLRSVKVSPCVDNSMTDKSAGITLHIGLSRCDIQALHFSLRQKKMELPI